MNLHIRVKYLKGLKGEVIERATSYHADDHFVDLSADALSESVLSEIYKRASSDVGKEGARALCQKISSYRNIRADPTGKLIGRLEQLVTALRAYIEPSPNKWVFSTEADGYPLPYYVSHIEYEKGNSKSGHPSYVSVTLAAITRGSKDGRSLRFYVGHLKRTVTDILNGVGYYLETPAIVEEYWKSVEVYKNWSSLTGFQFLCEGTGFPNSYSEYNTVAMVREGLASKVVMDDEEDEESSRRSGASGTTTSAKFWQAGASDEDEDDEEDNSGEDAGVVVTPVHPYVNVFDLSRHEFVLTHVNNLTPYVYDKSAEGKLVLPANIKTLVHILVAGSSEVMDDIIAGKTGGTIVIATGPPGTGKTLTAEVFAEAIEKPLYVVQCSQLGTDEVNLEKQLVKVLTRASRWKAILLIDEADVYIHERGADIQQNAIVGVFLRILERYRGVLFMTSNRATIIDDAIMSRATAWLRYEYPTPEEATILWTVLSKQYKMPLSESLIQELIVAFPKVSGRNINKIIQLARKLLVSSSKVSLDFKLFKYVTQFLDLRTDVEKESTG